MERFVEQFYYREGVDLDFLIEEIKQYGKENLISEADIME